MITKARPINLALSKIGSWILKTFVRNKFNKLTVDGVTIRPDHSYLLICNHFSFIDGPLAYYLCYQFFWPLNSKTKLFIMLQNRQMQQNKWLSYCGCFSIDARSRSVVESLEYAAELLSKPGNIVLIFPQGNLESIHVDTIKFQDGIKEVVKRVNGNCQLLWSSNIIEYFEGVKPSVYFNMLDCGTNHNFDFDKLKADINVHHKKSLHKYFRFTKRDD